MRTYLFVSTIVALLSACGGTVYPAGSGSSSSHETSGSSTTASSSTNTNTIETAPAPAPEPQCADEGAGSSTDSAAALALGSVNGCFGAEPDVFAVRATNHAAGTLFQFELTSSSALDVKIMDSEGQEIFSASVPSGQPGALNAVVASNSTAYLQVQGQGSGTYTLETTATPLMDASEPDDSQADAQPLNMGRRHTALLQSAVNAPLLGNDYYQVLVARDGTLSIEVEPGSDEIAIKVQLLSATGDALEETIASNRGAAVRVSARIRRGPYFIRVVDSQDSPQRAASSGAVSRYLSEPYSIVVDND